MISQRLYSQVMDLTERGESAGKIASVLGIPRRLVYDIRRGSVEVDEGNGDLRVWCPVCEADVVPPCVACEARKHPRRIQPEQETEADRISLADMPIHPRTVTYLGELGVFTVGDLLRVPNLGELRYQGRLVVGKKQLESIRQCLRRIGYDLPASGGN